MTVGVKISSAIFAGPRIKTLRATYTLGGGNLGAHLGLLSGFGYYKIPWINFHTQTCTRQSKVGTRWPLRALNVPSGYVEKLGQHRPRLYQCFRHAQSLLETHALSPKRSARSTPGGITQNAGNVAISLRNP